MALNENEMNELIFILPELLHLELNQYNKTKVRLTLI